MKLIDTPNFKRGIEILEKYESFPRIQKTIVEGEWYVGNMCKWEHRILEEEVKELQLLGFHWYEESECMLFNGSPKSIY